MFYKECDSSTQYYNSFLYFSHPEIIICRCLSEPHLDALSDDENLVIEVNTILRGQISHQRV